MIRTRQNAFHRAFPNKELLKGKARSALLWGSLSSLLFALLFIPSLLATDLLIQQGKIELSSSEISEYAELIGQPPEAIAAEESQILRLDDQGIGPTVWRGRNRFWGPPLATVSRQTPWLHQNNSALALLIASLILLGLLRHLLLSRTRVQAMHCGWDVADRLRQSVHRQTRRLGPSDLEDKETAYALQLFSDQVDQVRKGVFHWVFHLSRSPLQIALLLILALSIHWLLALQCLIPMAACWYWVQRKQRTHRDWQRQQQANLKTELQLLAESLLRTRLVRGYGMEKFEHEQFQQQLDRFREKTAQFQRKERRSQWGSQALVIATAAVVFYLIGNQILLPGETLLLAEATVLLATLAGLHNPLLALWTLTTERRAAAQSAAEIYRYLNQIPEVGQAVGAKFLQPLSHSVQFEAVRYALPSGRKLLDGLDLKLPAGQVTAIVAFDPLEARALAYLLPRFIEPQSGRVLFDSHDIAWVTLESLRAEAIFVGGNDPLFSSTVRENISGGDPRYTLQDVIAAAKETHAHNFIQKLPQGYETPLGPQGEKLDPGQTFRLGLTRAILRDPALMLIEEPSVSMDEGTKSLLDDAYQRIVRNRTVLFLPNRLSTLRRADHIILLYKGQVEAVGTHAKLVKSSQLYRHWEYVRFNVFRREMEVIESR